MPQYSNLFRLGEKFPVITTQSNNISSITSINNYLKETRVTHDSQNSNEKSKKSSSIISDSNDTSNFQHAGIFKKMLYLIY